MRLFAAVCFWIFLLSLAPVASVRSQTASIPPSEAAAATELPLRAWGPYSRAHIGPCCLISRLPEQVFAFPVVIGQRRNEIVWRESKTANGKTRLRPEKVVLERRAMGLSPVQAAGDDRPAAGIDANKNRRARMVEADADGLLWSARLSFAPVALAQDVAAANDENGKPIPSAGWSAGEAVVDYLPAFADPSADGLLVRVTLTNRATEPQTYFVDLLGGIDEPGAAFRPQDLTVLAASENSAAIVRHARCEAVFALGANATPYHRRLYRVSDAYFLPAGAVTQRDASGVVLPPGLLSPAAAGNGPADDSEAGRRHEHRPKPQKEERDEKPPALGNADTAPSTPDSPLWGLTRLDDIPVAPGETVTLFFCVGVGKDEQTSQDSARTLLGLAEDTMPSGTLRPGVVTKAREAHHAARFTSGDAAIDRLMAQSLANVPLFDWRRVGVPTRQDRPGRPGGVYQPEEGGLIALAWAFYRPDFAAAQMNAWFLTNRSADAPIAQPRAMPPTNLFALWELFQRTHNREMLARFYPYARRRYRELLAAGRVKADDWLFAWPATGPNGAADPTPAPAGTGQEKPHVYAPDYSAYVIRAAKILRLMAEQTRQPAGEISGYEHDGAEAARALNTTLWDSTRRLYLSKAASSANAASTEASAADAPGTSSGLLPLLAGADALAPEQRAALLKMLVDPASFRSRAGLRSASKAQSGYRAEAAGQGAVAFEGNWLLWKALLDLGEADTAHKLAEGVLNGYRAAQTASDTCPEWLDGDTGAAGGAADYSGSACALVPLYSAYHVPGTLSTGWDINLLDTHYDGPSDTLHAVFRALNATTPGALICVLGKPNGRYTLSGALTGPVTADADGVVTLTAPHDTTTQSLDITPTRETGK